MKTILRRNPRQRRGGLKRTALLLVLAGALAALLVLAWQHGGPQPLREISVALTDAPVLPEPALEKHGQ